MIYNIIRKQGESLAIRTPIYRVVNGKKTRVPLAGASAAFVFSRKKEPAPEDILFSKTVGAGITIEEHPTDFDALLIKINNTDTNIVVGTYYYEYVVRLSDGSTESPLSGEFKITRSVAAPLLVA